MNRVLTTFFTILVFIIASAIGRTYPGIVLQWVVAYILYWIGKKIVSKHTPLKEKNGSRFKLIIILSILGLLGYFSPIIGFVFVLPAYIFSRYLLTDDFAYKNIAFWLSGIILFGCILNANLGTILYLE